MTYTRLLVVKGGCNQQYGLLSTCCGHNLRAFPLKPETLKKYPSIKSHMNSCPCVGQPYDTRPLSLPPTRPGQAPGCIFGLAAPPPRWAGGHEWLDRKPVPAGGPGTGSRAHGMGGQGRSSRFTQPRSPGKGCALKGERLHGPMSPSPKQLK